MSGFNSFTVSNFIFFNDLFNDLFKLPKVAFASISLNILQYLFWELLGTLVQRQLIISSIWSFGLSGQLVYLGGAVSLSPSRVWNLNGCHLSLGLERYLGEQHLLCTNFK